MYMCFDSPFPFNRNFSYFLTQLPKHDLPTIVGKIQSTRTVHVLFYTQHTCTYMYSRLIYIMHIHTFRIKYTVKNLPVCYDIIPGRDRIHF